MPAARTLRHRAAVVCLAIVVGVFSSACDPTETVTIINGTAGEITVVQVLGTERSLGQGDELALEILEGDFLGRLRAYDDSGALIFDQEIDRAYLEDHNFHVLIE